MIKTVWEGKEIAVTFIGTVKKQSALLSHRYGVGVRAEIDWFPEDTEQLSTFPAGQFVILVVEDTAEAYLGVTTREVKNAHRNMTVEVLGPMPVLPRAHPQGAADQLVTPVQASELQRFRAAVLRRMQDYRVPDHWSRDVKQAAEVIKRNFIRTVETQPVGDEEAASDKA